MMVQLEGGGWHVLTTDWPKILLHSKRILLPTQILNLQAARHPHLISQISFRRMTRLQDMSFFSPNNYSYHDCIMKLWLALSATVQLNIPTHVLCRMLYRMTEISRKRLDICWSLGRDAGIHISILLLTRMSRTIFYNPQSLFIHHKQWKYTTKDSPREFETILVCRPRLLIPTLLGSFVSTNNPPRFDLH